ncbi:hypothetical protein E1301_Tti023113 [Triplophysa tibetana]|uniref:HAT C-terminal dimerisation domain-containing protein n=1 Tax=Triplophysa tibetana TaxID=1572043 RepID=A0A5A9PSI4_9TELE|nr:hypothetical protein E1301_Tti023113 [Triplophysa tibetana]
MLMSALYIVLDAPFDYTIQDMVELRKWYCVMLMENFGLDRHGKLFAHYTEESKAFLRGDQQPVYRLQKRKLEEISQEEPFDGQVTSQVDETILFNCEFASEKQVVQSPRKSVHVTSAHARLRVHVTSAHAPLTVHVTSAHAPLTVHVSDSASRLQPDAIGQGVSVYPELEVRVLFVGFLARRHLLSEEALSTSKTKQFFNDARAFYVRSFQKVKEKFPMRDQILTNLTVVNPENQDDVKPEQILTLAERFPNVIKADAREQLNVEILDYVSTNLETLVPNYKNSPVDEFWGKLSKVRSVSSGQLRFREICQLMKVLLVLPNSNCDVERAFSIVRHIKTEFRSQMSHQTLVNLMSCKINKFIDTECYEVEVSGKLLKSAKQAATKYNESLQEK